MFLVVCVNDTWVSRYSMSKLTTQRMYQNHSLLRMSASVLFPPLPPFPNWSLPWYDYFPLTKLSFRHIAIFLMLLATIGMTETGLLHSFNSFTSIHLYCPFLKRLWTDFNAVKLLLIIHQSLASDKPLGFWKNISQLKIIHSFISKHLHVSIQNFNWACCTFFFFSELWCAICILL